MGGAADQRAGADDVASDRQRQVVLAEMQHVGACRPRDVGAVVDREQRAVAARGVGEHLERGEFVAGLERAELLLPCRTLVPQLDDVDPARERRVGELRQVAALAAGVGAQVQRRRSQPSAQVARLGHTARVMWPSTREPGDAD